MLHAQLIGATDPRWRRDLRPDQAASLVHSWAAEGTWPAAGFVQDLQQQPSAGCPGLHRLQVLYDPCLPSARSPGMLLEEAGRQLTSGRRQTGCMACRSSREWAVLRSAEQLLRSSVGYQHDTRRGVRHLGTAAVPAVPECLGFDCLQHAARLVL